MSMSLSPRQAISWLRSADEDAEPEGSLVVGNPSPATVPVSDPAEVQKLAELVTSDVLVAAQAAREQLPDAPEASSSAAA